MLVNCVAYEDGRKLADIDAAARSATTSRGRAASSGWRCATPTDDELAEMQEEFGLHELAVEDARHGHQRPKIEEYGDSLFAVLHTVEVEGDELKVGEVDVFVGPNYVLSVRNRTERGFQDVRTRAEREPELLQARLGLRALRADGRGGRPLLPGARRDRDRAREARGAHLQPGASPRENIEALYYVKQKLTTLKHATAPAAWRTSASSTAGACRGSATGLGEYFRDVYDHLVRINQSIDAARDTVNTAIQVERSP